MTLVIFVLRVKSTAQYSLYAILCFHGFYLNVTHKQKSINPAVTLPTQQYFVSTYVSFFLFPCGSFTTLKPEEGFEDIGRLWGLVR